MDLLKAEQVLLDLEQKVEKQKKIIAEFKALSDDKKLAEIIHETQCHWNHIDGCGWHYESWDGPLSSTRQEHLKKARAILKDFTFEQAIKFVSKM